MLLLKEVKEAPAKVKTWADRIEEAEARGFFTLDDKALARSWTSCAVGETYEIRAPQCFPMRHYGASEEVVTWGCSFAWAVGVDDLRGARELYKLIKASKK